MDLILPGWTFPLRVCVLLFGWAVLIRFLWRWVKEADGFGHRAVRAFLMACSVVLAWVPAFRSHPPETVLNAVLLDLPRGVLPASASLAAIYAVLAAVCRRRRSDAAGTPTALERWNRAALVALFIAVAIVLMALDVPWIMSHGPDVHMNDSSTLQRRVSSSMSSMYNIFQAVWDYADDHQLALPYNLEQLVEEGYLEPAALVNPRWPEASPGYVFLRPADSFWDLLVPARERQVYPILLYEAYDVWPPIGVNVLYSDGHISIIETEDRFRWFIAAQGTLEKLDRLRPQGQPRH